MQTVFVSYARKSLSGARQLVEALRFAGIHVWWDQDIPADAEWETTIEQALSSASCVIVCWTTSAASSENVKAEARHARNHGRLLQAYLEPCTPPLFFGERQGANLTEWDGDPNAEQFQLLLDGVKSVLQGKRPRAGLGYQPRDRRLLPTIAIVVAIVLAAGVGVLWIPEVRERVFPKTPVVWTMTAGSSADIRPALPPSERPLDRMTSQVLIGLAAEFSTEGGRRAEATISSQGARLHIPLRQPVEFVWLHLTNNKPETKYLDVTGAAGTFAINTTGSRETFFTPTFPYVWAQFVRDIERALGGQAKYLVIEAFADVESEGKEHHLSARCRLSIDEVMQLMRQRRLDLEWISLPCSSADPPEGQL